MSLAADHSRDGTLDPTLAWQQHLVANVQAELIRACYLLTGDPQTARQLASRALLDLFRETNQLDDVDQGRTQLLINAGQRYLARDYVDEAGAARPAHLPQTPESQYAPVDDEPDRLLATLARLDAYRRVTLVLREYSKLDDELIARALGQTPDALHGHLEPARERLREAVGAPTDLTIRSLLALATRDAPYPNLWPLVEEPLREREQQRQARARRLTFTIVAGVITLLAVGTAWLVAGFDWLNGGGQASEAAIVVPSPEVSLTATATPEPEPTSTPMLDRASLDMPRADIPSTIVIHARSYPTLNMSGTDEPRRTTYSYDIFDNQLTELSQDQPVPTVISADGRWGLSLKWREDEGALASIELIRLIDPRTSEVQWEKTFDEDERISQVGFAGQWVYAFDRVSPSRLILYDIEDGREVATRENFTEDLWTFDGHQPSEPPQFFAAPDGRELWVNLRGSWPWLRQGMSWGWQLASYSLPDLTLELKRTREIRPAEGSWPESFGPSNTVWTPDSGYLVTLAQETDQLLFLSPEEELQEVDLSFTPEAGPMTDEVRPPGLMLIPSNTGRYLYVLATDRGEVAIVDLLTRQLLRVAPIDPGGFMLTPVPNTQTRSRTSANVVLSPDGKRLYVANAWTPGGQPWDDRQDATITVLDTTTWSVVDQWVVPSSEIWGLFPLDGGQQIATLTYMLPEDPSATGSVSVLTVFDTETGEQVLRRTEAKIPFPEWVDGFSINSRYADYRRTYNRSPIIDSVPIADAEIASTLPRVQLVTESTATPASIPFEVEVRIEDPITGDLLTGSKPDVRFDPQSIVSVTFEHEEEETDGVLIVLRRSSDGIYRGTASLDEAGEWHATVTVTSPEGDPWSVEPARPLAVSETLEGADGERYAAVLETDPEEPRPYASVTFTVHFVNAQTRKPIPEGVDLVGGLPEELDILRTSPEAGSSTIELQPVTHGVYQGEETFRSMESWRLRLRFRLPKTEQIVTLDAGAITISP